MNIFQTIVSSSDFWWTRISRTWWTCFLLTQISFPAFPFLYPKGISVPHPISPRSPSSNSPTSGKWLRWQFRSCPHDKYKDGVQAFSASTSEFTQNLGTSLYLLSSFWSNCQDSSTLSLCVSLISKKKKSLETSAKADLLVNLALHDFQGHFDWLPPHMSWPTRARNESATQVRFLDWGLNTQSFGVVGQCSNHCTTGQDYVVNPHPTHWFLERVGERKRGVKETSMRETSIGCLLHTPQPGQASKLQCRCMPLTLTRNQSDNTSVLGPTL